MSDEYAREVTRVAIGHMLLRWNELLAAADDGEQHAVKLMDSAAVELMVDSVLHYVRTIGRRTKLLMARAGRAAATSNDVIESLLGLHPGADFPNQLRAMALDDKWDAPFEHVVPSFPVVKRARFGSAAAAGSGISARIPRPLTVPPGLPALPEPHTYRTTFVPAVPRAQSSQQLRKRTLDQKQDAQRALARWERAGGAPLPAAGLGAAPPLAPFTGLPEDDVRSVALFVSKLSAPVAPLEEWTNAMRQSTVSKKTGRFKKQVQHPKEELILQGLYTEEAEGAGPGGKSKE